MQLVERVARAICRAHYLARNEASHLDPFIDERVNENWHEFIPEARASIAIQRELIQQLRDALSECAEDSVCVAIDYEQKWGPVRQARIDELWKIVADAREAIAAADAALREQP